MFAQIFAFMIVIGIFYFIFKAFRSVFGGNGKASHTGSKICPHCGTQGEPKTITKGSTGVELILWICFLVPGLIYSFWRLSSKYEACPACDQAGMIKVDSPKGQLLAKQFSEKI